MNRIIWPLFLQILGQFLTGFLRAGNTTIFYAAMAVFMILTVTGYIVKLK